MSADQTLTSGIQSLVRYAIHHGLIEAIDTPYYFNLLMARFGLEAPAETEAAENEQAVPSTATSLLKKLCDQAVQRELIEDLPTARELFATSLMGILTPEPASVRKTFRRLYENEGPSAATNWFYRLCETADYVKVDAIAQNIRYFADTVAGRLEITVNLSKPEKDPREIARLKNVKSVSYPKCMLCVENPGYAGRSNFPARQNHRIVPVKLAGEDWYLQYSPYAYYNEHCIVLSGEHRPMKISHGSFERLFDFVRQYPHYCIGSNADLPIVGGSILNHDHFQGGNYRFPMDDAPARLRLTAPEGIRAELLNWPLTAICLTGTDPEPMIAQADKILNAWREYSDPEADILAYTGDTPHNTVTPILRKVENNYRLMLVLRNNRTSEEHPLGIFHPHAQLHHIKRENIGLIEVMGLFILPGRLKNELAELELFLTGERQTENVQEDDACAKHMAWIKDILARKGTVADRESAAAILRQEVADVCAQVLADAGVYKQTEAGVAAFLRFAATLGMTEMKQV